MTLNDYLTNPMGKGNAVIPYKFIITQDLEIRYEKLIQKKGIVATPYIVDGEYAIHFIVPSESERNNTYDVVLLFDESESNIIDEALFRNYNLLFFSNCPSFNYTYAYVYNKEGLIIPYLKDKYDGITLKQAPVMRNPQEIKSFEKSTYFACLYLKKNPLFQNKLYLSRNAKKITTKQFNKLIRPFVLIEKEIQKENSIIKEEKREKVDKVNHEAKYGTRRSTMRAVDNLSKKRVTSKAKITGKKKISGKKKR